jgi:hypothetical protein
VNGATFGSQGRILYTRLNGVSAARRKQVKPCSVPKLSAACDLAFSAAQAIR